MVADFAINVNTYIPSDVRLDKTPVTVEIRNGRLTSFRCDNEEISKFLEKSFKRQNAINVGELGFGTNRAIGAVPQNSHLNERVPGIHIGFGQHNQSDNAAGYFCDIHIDLCAKGGLVWFDEGKDPLDLEHVPPSRNPHPILVRNDDIRSEDVFSDDMEEDCCGLLR